MGQLEFNGIIWQQVGFHHDNKRYYYKHPLDSLLVQMFKEALAIVATFHMHKRLKLFTAIPQLFLS